MLAALSLFAGPALAAPGDVALQSGQHARLDLNGDGKPEEILWVERPSDNWVSLAGWDVVDGVSRRTVAAFTGTWLVVRAAKVGGWSVIEVLSSLPSVHEHRLSTYEAHPAYTEVRSVEPTNDEVNAIVALPKPPAVGIPSLCDPDTFVFGCESATGKTVSVCQKKGQSEYRFGRPGAIELTVPGGKRVTEDAPNQWWSAMTFTNDGVAYQVTERWDVDPSSKQRTRAASGVRVSRGDETLVEVTCGPNVFGTLQAL